MNERKHWIYVLLLLVIPSQTAVFLFQWVSDNKFWDSFPKEKSTLFLISAILLVLISVWLLISSIKTKGGLNKRTVLPLLIKVTLAFAAFAIGISVIQELFFLLRI